MQSEGTVNVDHHQFIFGELYVDTTEPESHGTLIDAGQRFVSFYTGIAYGPVRVRVELHERTPDDDRTQDWEVVEETTIEAETEMRLAAIDGTIVASVGSVAPGNYMLRAHARGRDNAYGQDVSQPCEDYLIVLWPTDQLAAGVRTLRKTDIAWSPSTQVDESSLSTEYVYIRDESGAVLTVPPQSPEAKAVRTQMKQFGGRPLTPALEAVYSSRNVAGLDRELIDWVEATDEDQRWAFARWCVRRAWERAGIADLEWWQAVLEDMDAGTIGHPDFIASNAARNRLDADPRIRRTIVSGLPAKHEMVQQYMALLTYTRSMYPGVGSLEAAIEAFWGAARTYGMDYLELTAAAHREFLDR
ncbi:hypothetical protein [Rhodococcus pyridinivorans]|uniref:hypothetical protein n=1 Tax=Rhodococcus pyridinivorans TaxID=103816 RepID=UPI0020787D21|nr:hypothetical protein [Rhodococcus pyridinivorans]USI88413.1 hypothetical protein LLA01_12255 [Rhodococcus pyridinivorans]